MSGSPASMDHIELDLDMLYQMDDPEVPEGGVTQPQNRHLAEVRRSISVGARLSSPYLVMNALATVVASYGLLADSTAVVIGAMIIAMLLGPIMGLALAMVDGDTSLFRNSMVAEVLGAGLVVGIGALIGRLHFDIGITPEILSRTQPNLLDLAIALAGGAAGAYATASPRVSVGLVGVAISTALVPPLASCGICLSRGLIPQASGAFILFATNLVAIQCAASVVLYIFGFHNITQRQAGDRGYLRRLLVDGTIFVGLAVFLYFQLAATVAQRRFEELVRERLQRGIIGIPGAYLAETRFVVQGKRQIVIAVVRVPNSITPIQTAQLQTLLGKPEGRPVELHVRSLLTKETTSQGYLHEIQPDLPPADAPPDEGLLEPTPGLSDSRPATSSESQSSESAK